MLPQPSVADEFVAHQLAAPQPALPRPATQVQGHAQVPAQGSLQSLAQLLHDVSLSNVNRDVTPQGEFYNFDEHAIDDGEGGEGFNGFAAHPELVALPPLPTDILELQSNRIQWNAEGVKEQFKEFENVMLHILHAMRATQLGTASGRARADELLDRAVRICHARMEFLNVANLGGYEAAQLFRDRRNNELAQNSLVRSVVAQVQRDRNARRQHAQRRRGNGNFPP